LGAFGEKLRKQREQRGVTLDAISNTTKISTRMLRALEDEHFDQLPGGVFNKGFVRAYARQVGLNEEEAINDYLSALRETQVQSQNILPDFRNPVRNPIEVPAAKLAQQPRRHETRTDVRDGNHQDNNLRGTVRPNDARPDNLKPATVPVNKASSDVGLGADQQNRTDKFAPKKTKNRLHEDSTEVLATRAKNRSRPDHKTGISWGKFAAVLLFISAALAFWNLRRQSQVTTTSPPAVTASQAPAPTATSSAVTSSSSNEGSTSVEATSRASKPPVEKTSATPPPATTLASTTPAATAKPISPATAVTSPPVAVTRPPATNVAASIPTVKPPVTFTLLIRADKTSWISILADGKPVAEETLIAPAHTSVRATREIVVRAGNAAGISFLLNGKEIPAQGDDGEVKTYAFDSSTVRVLPQSQLPNANH
jgi:cytoskeletal protein RodZ